VHSVEGAAYRILHLLHNPDVALRIGRIAREHVRRHFLITRHLADYLMLLRLMTERAGPEMRAG
jgi:trehalose synthase